MARPSFQGLPPQRAPLVNTSALCTDEWYLALRRLESFMQAAGVDPAIIADILDRLEKLEQGGSFLMQGFVSVQVIGTPSNGVVQLQLVNDEATPGNTFIYGTDGSGNKGWFELFAAFVGGAGINLSSDTAGRITIALADLPDSGNGSLLAIERDAKGRVAGSRAAVAGDLPTHPHNSHSGIQGGAPDDYQHLTAAQVAKVDALPDPGGGGPVVIGDLMILRGDGVIAPTGTHVGSVVINFGAAFGAPPTVVATINGGAGIANAAGGIPTIGVNNITTTGAVVNIDTNAFGTTVNLNFPVPFNFIALGPAP